ncbi:hypothetical protein CEXT_761071 [Caerostris extrusa]|uniref:Uncharacterized protein n=1 Tax=Caerostris extrusa TaxID=172846 RepID=A0AAV4Q8U9_CAEEX|nr:hypothetical protein CEXT_761071 [Caerostris extrusa]
MKALSLLKELKEDLLKDNGRQMFPIKEGILGFNGTVFKPITAMTYSSTFGCQRPWKDVVSGNPIFNGAEGRDGILA